MQEEFILPGFKVSPPQHADRRELYLKAGQSLKWSWEHDFKLCPAIKMINCEMPIGPIENAFNWKNKRFGAVNTVDKAACLVFVAKYILDYFGYHFSVEDILSECVQKEYRLWKLEYRNKVFGNSIIELDFLKKEFIDDSIIQECKSLRELYKVAGYPVGIGASAFFLDNIINMFSGEDVDNSKVYRINSVGKLLLNLSKGIPVPIRIGNATYYNDPSMKEGHYLVLVGLSDGVATVIDTSIGNPIGKPIELVFEAMFESDQLIAAWDLSPMKRND